MDSGRACCWVCFFFRRMVCVTLKAKLEYLPEFSVKSGRNLIRYSVSREARIFPTSFWMQDISLVTFLQTNSKASNNSFTLIIHPSIISQSTIFKVREKYIHHGFFFRYELDSSISKLKIPRMSVLIKYIFLQSIPTLTVEYSLISHLGNICFT